MREVLVIGSTNMDIVAKMDYLPKPGETIGGAMLFHAFGGKGANQAVAAARTGGNVTFVGCTGNDASGRDMISNLNNEGIKTGFMQTVPEVASGTALIFVDKGGENCIAVAPGANNNVSIEMVNQVASEIEHADLIILQLEIPYETIKHICKVAKRFNTKVLLNPSPARSLNSELFNAVEYLILNETEIEELTGLKIKEHGFDLLCKSLYDQGSNNIILTLGSKGSYIYNNKVQKPVPGFKVSAVDSTGAGDTFCGAFGSAVTTMNMDIIDAVRFANAAGALSVTKKGAQSSIPAKKEIEDFLHKHEI